MREEKWGILERFRIRHEYENAVPAGLLRRFVTQRLAALGDGYVLGPFELHEQNGTWWTLLWEFETRDDAKGLLEQLDDERWNQYVETRVSQGFKYLPDDGLPGF